MPAAQQVGDISLAAKQSITLGDSGFESCRIGIAAVLECLGYGVGGIAAADLCEGTAEARGVVPLSIDIGEWLVWAECIGEAGKTMKSAAIHTAQLSMNRSEIACHSGRQRDLPTLAIVFFARVRLANP